MIAVAELIAPVKEEWERDGDWDTERSFVSYVQWNANEVTVDCVRDAIALDLHRDGWLPFGVQPRECRVSRWRVVTWDDDWDALVLYWSNSGNLGADELRRAWLDGELDVVDKLECWG